MQKRQGTSLALRGTGRPRLMRRPDESTIDRPTTTNRTMTRQFDRLTKYRHYDNSRLLQEFDYLRPTNNDDAWNAADEIKQMDSHDIAHFLAVVYELARRVEDFNG